MTVLSAAQVREVLRAKVDALGGVREASRQLGVSETAIRACINSGSDPGEKIARSLGFRRMNLFERIPKRDAV